MNFAVLEKPYVWFYPKGMGPFLTSEGRYSFHDDSYEIRKSLPAGTVVALRDGGKGYGGKAMHHVEVVSGAYQGWETFVVLTYFRVISALEALAMESV